MNQTQDSSDIEENADEVNKEYNVERCLEVIEEETSHITCTVHSGFQAFRLNRFLRLHAFMILFAS